MIFWIARTLTLFHVTQSVRKTWESVGGPHPILSYFRLVQAHVSGVFPLVFLKTVYMNFEGISEMLEHLAHNSLIQGELTKYWQYVSIYLFMKEISRQNLYKNLSNFVAKTIYRSESQLRILIYISNSNLLMYMYTYIRICRSGH